VKNKQHSPFLHTLYTYSISSTSISVSPAMVATVSWELRIVDINTTHVFQCDISEVKKTSYYAKIFGTVFITCSRSRWSRILSSFALSLLVSIMHYICCHSEQLFYYLRIQLPKWFPEGFDDLKNICICLI
jgi:hypothetical protein